MQAVTLYTTGHCPYCVNAKTLLTRKGVTYEEIDVGSSPQRLAEMLQRSNRRSVPQRAADLHRRAACRWFR